MGSDRAPQHGGSHRGISIHAPRMGSDAARQDDVHGRAISIHAPRMGSDPQSYTIAPIPPISIHAPRMGSDLRISCAWVTVSRFQSTLPGWGATRRQSHFITEDIISIHAPRMGSDVSDAERKGLEQYFNPRSPDGERRCAGQNGSPPRLDFNPRSPDGERHSLGRLGFGVDYFNPRSPDGERRPGTQRQDQRWHISIHAPRMGSD